MKKRILKPLAFVLGLSLLAGQSSMIRAAQVYYEVSSTQEISKGLTYETSRRVVEGGLLDVHVLTVPSDDPYLKLSAFSSQTEYGLKETTSKILADNNAIAGINGDFFGVAGSYSVPLGLAQTNGGNLSVESSTNTNGDVSATFFLNENSEPFIEYIKSSVSFINNGSENIIVNGINKTVDLARPICITYEAIKNTAALDARIPGSYKIVVEANVVTYISQCGETVNVPENGFIIIMKAQDYEACKDLIEIGHSAEMSITSTVDLDKIQTAVSGEAMLIKNGVINTKGDYAPGRHPRTAIGISEDGKNVIMMVVDGRTHSIGASHRELAELMAEYGAYNAMYLDGGGSATMAVVPQGYNELLVVNRPSDNYQRKVINVFGVVDNAPIGEICSIGIELERSYLVKSMPISIKVYGYDEYYHRIEIPQDEVLIIGQDLEYDGVRVTTQQTGGVTVFALYNGMMTQKSFRSHEVAQLHPNVSEITTILGNTTPLSFSGLTNDGFNVMVDSSAMVFEVNPPDLGEVLDGVFYSHKIGTGYVKCIFLNAVVYIGVDSTTITPEKLYSMENQDTLSFTSYPSTVTGSITKGSSEDLPSVKMEYSFIESNEAQAAYLMLGNNPETSGLSDILGFRINVYGDNSKHWLRGRIIDANGNFFMLDFIWQINFEGWKQLDAFIPAGAVYPITLERIYAVSIAESEKGDYELYFGEIEGLFPQKGGVEKAEILEGTKASDPLYIDSSMDYNAINGYEIAFIGLLGNSYGETTEEFDSYAANRSKAALAVGEVAAAVAFENYDISWETNITTYHMEGSYRVIGLNDLTVVQMYGSKGGFSLTDPKQWANIRNDIIYGNTQNIIFQTDTNPYSFKHIEEFNLFHSLLKEAAEMGKNIFVVSSGGAYTTSFVHEGVRYINLAVLYDGAKLNNSFGILRFTINGKDIRYHLDNI